MAELKKPTHKGNAVKGEVIKTRTEESLDVLVGQLEGSLPQQFSDKHIDRYFDNKEKLFRHIREDHKDQKDLIKHSRKYKLFYLIASGVIIIAIMIVIIWSDKGLLGKFFELLFAFLGGTGFGTLLGKKNSNGIDE